MGRLSGLLDRIPAAYEHMAIIFLAVFAYTIAAAVLAAHRASVLWESWTVWSSALDAADGWDANAWHDALDPYFEEHESIGTGPDSVSAIVTTSPGMTLPTRSVNTPARSSSAIAARWPRLFSMA